MVAYFSAAINALAIIQTLQLLTYAQLVPFLHDITQGAARFI